MLSIVLFQHIIGDNFVANQSSFDSKTFSASKYCHCCFHTGVSWDSSKPIEVAYVTCIFRHETLAPSMAFLAKGTSRINLNLKCRIGPALTDKISIFHKTYTSQRLHFKLWLFGMLYKLYSIKQFVCDTNPSYQALNRKRLIWTLLYGHVSVSPVFNTHDVKYVQVNETKAWNEFKYKTREFSRKSGTGIYV